MHKILFAFFVFCSLAVVAQIPTQTIKGKVFDMDSKSPLVGATIMLGDSTLGIGASSDENGDFRIDGVPVGRQIFIAQYIGYREYRSDEIVVTSGKELTLNIGLVEELVKEQEVLITANKSAGTAKPVNDFATVSTRSFSVEQVQRYPATLFDPSRTVMSSPGVQQSIDYQNDIIIRGNSPMGLTWRLEGIDIANPNHFSRIGGTGGSISVFSLSLMGESDFSSGAFAPEYGNATSGVFDMHFRKGNNEKREYTIRAGMIGLDFATEGPIQKGKSSYLLNYRYSTLAILDKLGFRFTFDNSTTRFQDLSFNLNFKTSQNGNLSIFGVGGNSMVKKDVTQDTSEWKSFDNYFKTNYHTSTGAVGATYTHLLDEKSYVRAVIVATANHIKSTEDTLNKITMLPGIISRDTVLTGRYAATISYNRKVSARATFKTGIFVNQLFYNIHSDTLQWGGDSVITLNKGKGNMWLFQGYTQMRYRATEKLTFTGGLHALYLLMNQTHSIEPRLGASYVLNGNHSFSAAYGLHGQILPVGTYFVPSNTSINPDYPNKDLKMIKAHHFVLGYNFNFLGAFRIKTETYYQSLFNLPVSANPEDTYSPLNDRFGYGRGTLVSKGRGRNYGLDLTVERFFSNRMFFLVTGSVFRSQYQPQNGNWYSTRFDNKFSSSYMIGKEFPLKNGSAFEAGARLVYSGGLRYTPPDSLRTSQEGYWVIDMSRVNTMHLKNYFRIDGRIAYRWSKPKYSSSVSLDFQNMTNHKNPTEYYWDNINKNFFYRYGSGFIGVVTFMIDF